MRLAPTLPAVACILLLSLSAARAASLAGVFSPASAEEDEYASVKEYYSEGETSNICLRKTTIKTCDIIGLLSAVRYE